MNKMITRHRFGQLNPHLDLERYMASGNEMINGTVRSFIDARTEHEYQQFLAKLETGEACLFPEIVVEATDKHHKAPFLLLGEVHGRLSKTAIDPFTLTCFTDQAFKSCADEQEFFRFIRKWVAVVEQPAAVEPPKVPNAIIACKLLLEYQVELSKRKIPPESVSDHVQHVIKIVAMFEAACMKALEAVEEFNEAYKESKK